MAMFITKTVAEEIIDGISIPAIVNTVLIYPILKLTYLKKLENNFLVIPMTKNHVNNILGQYPSPLINVKYYLQFQYNYLLP